MVYDVIIIGGGPAGLNAALVLGRSRRSVLICDNNDQRNIKSKEMHAFLSRDGINPAEFLDISRQEVMKYDIQRETMKIIEAKKNGEVFEVINERNEKYYSRKILIATGIKDNIPDIPGMDKLYGISIHHCPYCDGWEVRDKSIAVYAKGKAAFALTRSLKTWSNNIILCTDGPTELSLEEKLVLNSLGVRIIRDKIKQLEGENGHLKKIIFSNSKFIECDALFFSTGHRQKSNLAEQLGCKFSRKGHIITNIKQKTGVEGVFAAGDAAKDIQFVVVAAAEGAKAGVVINMELQEEEYKKHLQNNTELTGLE